MSGYLIFGGIDSRDYDVFVSFSDIDTVPRRVYTKVDIVGKNGSVLIDEGKYEDVPHSYDCIVLDNEKRVAFVNAIMSKKGYQRLTDSYGTDEYYIAVLEENIEQNTTRIRDKYKFKLIFTRKPQRFLTSGEEPIDTSELGGEVTTDKIPYLFRRSGGGNIGHDFDAEIDKIIGGTVAWNQLRSPNVLTDYVKSGITFNINSNGLITANGTATNESILQINSPNGFRAYSGHKYLIYISDSLDSNFNFQLRLSHTDADSGSVQLAFINKSSIIDYTNSEYEYLIARIHFNRGAVVSKSFYTYSIDLTQAFGSEIADYVYSLEQTTEGSGIAWLKSHGFLTKDYYAYNEGSLLSVKTSEHRMVGKNKCDINGFQPSTSSVNVSVSGQTITVSGGSAIGYPAANYGNASNLLFPAGTYYIKANVKSITQDNIGAQIGMRNASNTFAGARRSITLGQMAFTMTITEPCYFSIMIKGNGQTGIENTVVIEDIMVSTDDSAFEPYHINSYPLDSDLELRGIPKLSNGSLYYDGDIYESSGAVTRKYGYRAYQSGDESLADAITDGTNTVYKLTTPTTEQAAPYANPQIVNPLGTEEYVDTRDVPVPVGHETKYGMSQLVLSNPTEFPSKPLLEVTDAGTFWLGDTLFTITGTAGQTIYIDCETGEAWKNVGGIITPANGLVSLNRLDFPELDPGDTPVMYGAGITKVVVTPRWWII